jgi:hypothetical protein
MNTKIEAALDGQVFRPVQPIFLPPNTTVGLTFEPLSSQARSLFSHYFGAAHKDCR